MADEDELELLRAADPVDVSDLPQPGGPEARALFERITMTDTRVAPTEAPSPATDPPRKRPLAAVAAAAALALVVAVAAFALTRPDGDNQPEEVTTPGSDAPISPGGMASCVEMYGLTTIENREVAFVGTVKSVDGDKVTFAIDEAFRGVSAAEVTLDGAQTLGGLTSAGDGLSLEPGTKLLVSGDGGFVWSCGFTQPYDADVAAQWRSAFGD